MQDVLITLSPGGLKYVGPDDCLQAPDSGVEDAYLKEGSNIVKLCLG
jgi:hypothetical protein